jgi:hypothetical protein
MGELYDIYRQLTVEEGRELASFALTLLDSDYETTLNTVEDIIRLLACLVPGALKGFHKELALREICLYHGFPFRDADAETRDLFIRELLLLELETASAKSLRLDHILKAVVWIGDDVVQALFRRWRERPLRKRFGLHVPPEEYALEAGWELTDEGQRRNLYYNDCYPLVPTEHEQSESPVSVISNSEARCGGCGRRLVTLLDLDLTSPRLSFLNLKGERLRIATCEHGDLFYTETDTYGKSQWSEYNEPSDLEEMSDLPELYMGARKLILSEEPRGACEAFLLGSGASQIGGFPSWIQDAEYPVCPKCKKRMKFIGQLQSTDFLGEPASGITYALVCSEGHMAATVYQQT